MSPPRRRRHARSRTTRWGLFRDTSTILGGALLALIGAQLLSAGVPGASSDPFASAAAIETAVAIGSEVVGPTLPPIQSLGPVVNPSAGFDATPTPVPFATLGPGTLTVYVQVTNDNGGNDVASDWQVSIDGARATPITFPGSATGSTFAISPDKTFTIATDPKTANGYVETRSGDCGGSIPKGTIARCYITENDRPVALTVKVVISSGGDPSPPKASSIAVTVSGSGVDDPSFSGSSSGTLVHLDSNAAYAVKAAAPTDYVKSTSSGCSSTKGLPEGRAVTCTLTFTYSPAPTPTPTQPPPTLPPPTEPPPTEPPPSITPS